MSTDFFISLDGLEGAGVLFEERYCEYMEEDCTYASFPGYPYYRDVELDESESQVHISCSGQFRSWLRAFLEKESVEYEEC